MVTEIGSQSSEYGKENFHTEIDGQEDRKGTNRLNQDYERFVKRISSSEGSSRCQRRLIR